MAVSAAGIKIINDALVLVSEEPITSSDGSSPAEKFADNRYEAAVLKMLSRHRWRFARKIDDNLNLLSGSPLARFSYAYQAPNDMLFPVTLYGGKAPIPFERVGDEIHASRSDDVKLEYIWRVPDASLPDYFVEALVYSLAAEAGLSLASDPQFYKLLKADYRESLDHARLLDSQSGSTRTLGARSNLLAAHGGRGSIRGAGPGEEGYGI